MKLTTTLTSMLSGVILTVSVSAVTINNPWLPEPGGRAGELNLKDIMNYLYPQDAWSEVSNSEVEGLFGQSGELRMTALFAGYTQSLYLKTISGSTIQLLGNFGNGTLLPSRTREKITFTFPTEKYVIFDRTTGGDWYSNDAFNPNNEQHMVAFLVTKAWKDPNNHSFDTVDLPRNTYVLGFEDLPLNKSDKDYQDLVVEIIDGPTGAPVPDQGTTMIFLGTAFIVGNFLRRKG